MKPIPAISIQIRSPDCSLKHSGYTYTGSRKRSIGLESCIEMASRWCFPLGHPRLWTIRVTERENGTQNPQHGNKTIQQRKKRKEKRNYDPTNSLLKLSNPSARARPLDHVPRHETPSLKRKTTWREKCAIKNRTTYNYNTKDTFHTWPIERL